jgi:HEAT repeat protein
MVQQLVRDAAIDLRNATGPRIDEIVDLVVTRKLNKEIADGNRKEARDEVRNQLQGLQGHRADQVYQATVVRAVLTFLLGELPPAQLNLAEFEPVVLLEEEILLALGRTRTAEAVAALRRILVEHPDHPLRAEVCLALGMSGDMAAARDLAPRLLDSDPFVRFCAYEGVRHLTGQDFWADWMYGTLEERVNASQQYFRWCAHLR